MYVAIALDTKYNSFDDHEKIARGKCFAPLVGFNLAALPTSQLFISCSINGRLVQMVTQTVITIGIDLLIYCSPGWVQRVRLGGPLRSTTAEFLRVKRYKFPIANRRPASRRQWVGRQSERHFRSLFGRSKLSGRSLSSLPEGTRSIGFSRDSKYMVLAGEKTLFLCDSTFDDEIWKSPGWERLENRER
jgi:hypothetical protein